MMYLWVVLFLLLGLTVFLLCSRARIIIEYRDKDFQITVKIGFLKLSFNGEKIKRLSGDKKEKKQAPEKESPEPHERFFDKIKALKKKYNETKPLINTFLGGMRYKVSVSELYIYVGFGTGDAASTGALYGGVWALIGNAYVFLCRYFNMSFPQLELEPDFNKKLFEPVVKGIITVRPVHIIIALLRSIRAYKKYKNNQE